jgi:hypothetical protein
MDRCFAGGLNGAGAHCEYVILSESNTFVGERIANGDRRLRVFESPNHALRLNDDQREQKGATISYLVAPGAEFSST